MQTEGRMEMDNGVVKVMLKVYFDNSVKQIKEWQKEFDLKFGQFRTPLTQYAKGDLPWILDNGCFTSPWQLPLNDKGRTFMRMAHAALQQDSGCQFIVVPDVVGNADDTLDQFLEFTADCAIPSSMAAYVAQDGQMAALVPWEDIGCLFIGGSDSYKDGVQSYLLALEAKKRNKWVHVGRVNTTPRVIQWFDVADSIDGSGIARFTWMRERFLNDLLDLQAVRQSKLSEWV